MAKEVKPKIMADSQERRFVAIDNFEIRAGDDDKDQPTVLAGYAALFNTLSDDLGGFQERIAPGAFAKSIGGDVRALFNHDRNIVLGRTKAKTLTVAEDNRGLVFEIIMPDTGAARDLIHSIERKDVDQMSFGFRVIDDLWEEVDGVILRTLIEVKLQDVSPVTVPAYPDTSVAVRSLNNWKAENEAEIVPDYSGKLKALDLMALE